MTLREIILAKAQHDGGYATAAAILLLVDQVALLRGEVSLIGDALAQLLGPEPEPDEDPPAVGSSETTAEHNPQA